MSEIITVTALNTYVRSILEGDPNLSDITIRGEIANFTRNHSSGHCYFSLSDNSASIRAVMFRADAQQQSFRPENGMQVLARGQVTLYGKSGSYQLIVRDFFPDGQGAIGLAYEQVYRRLEKEGLFAPENKKELPHFPECVGLITSKTGAALQDILNVAGRRYPFANILLYPVPVQGMEAVEKICRAVSVLDGHTGVDVIVIARGGGSSEDLWLFNDERIARAVSAAKTPVVSAIGHEIDTTILDHVADLRAPTPSAAAELVFPDMSAAGEHLERLCKDIVFYMQQKLASCYNTVGALRSELLHYSPDAQLARYTEKLGFLSEQIYTAANHRREAAIQRLERSVAMAGSLNPYAVVTRGYGIVRVGETPITSGRALTPGEPFSVLMRDSVIEGTVISVQES